jgi:hypothetical protein
MMTIEIKTTIAVEGKKQATRMPIPRKMAASAATLGRIFTPHHPISHSSQEAAV